jgi:nucleoside-diphosphate-sugar epimerase
MSGSATSSIAPARASDAVSLTGGPGRQAEIVAEEARVQHEVLVPRGLDERRVLLIGGAGYVGSEITAQLLEAGYNVRTVDLLVYDNGVAVLGFLRNPHYEFRRLDLVDTDAIVSMLEGVTDVIVLAGLVGDPITKAYPAASEAINVEGTRRLLDALDGHRINKVLFVSTCSNYGLIPDGVLADEGFDLKPLSLYARAKVVMEDHLRERKDKVDYHFTILRFATAFGLSPRMRFDLTVSEFTREMFLGRELLVFDAETWRPYCHVGDFGVLIRRVLEAPLGLVDGEVFNAGGDVNNFTKQMIVDYLKSRLPDAPVRFQEHGSDPRNYRVSFARVRERLAFEPEITVPDGIDELLGALDAGLFEDVDARRSFYGNYELRYP